MTEHRNQFTADVYSIFTNTRYLSHVTMTSCKGYSFSIDESYKVGEEDMAR